MSPKVDMLALIEASGKTPAARTNSSILFSKNIPLYRNSELRHSLRHPGPRSGAIVRRHERGPGCGGRGSAGHAKAGPGRDEPREGLDCVRDGWRLCPAKPLGGAGSLRTAKTRGPDRRCYGQALRRWIGALPGFEASPIREVTEARRNSAPGRAGISRQPIAQGRPGVPASPVCCCAVSLRYTFAQRTAGASRHPVFPAPSSQRRVKVEAKLGHLMPREGCFMCDLSEGMVLPDRIELSTSPLPMECSTTELRQHVLG